jgi:tetratricopeptide (TPR) repeat protein
MLLTRKTPPLFFVTPVWGDNHINIFLKIGLPSLLAQGNLPSAAIERECRFLIYTRAEEEHRLIDSDAFRRLETLMPVEVTWIAEPLGDNPHRIMSDCHAAALHRADAEDAAAVFVPPDCVWSNGSMANLARLVDAGKAMVHISGIRLDRDAMAPRLRTHLNASGGALTIDARSLVSLGLEHLHAIAKLHFWNEFEGGLMPANLYWSVPGEGLALRCFHLHPLMVKAQKKFCRFESTIDDDLALHACPDESGDYVVTDSDEILAFELSGPERAIAGNFEKGSAESVAAWMEVGANARHQKLAERPIRVHSCAVTEARWRSIEQESGALIGALRQINRLSSFSLAIRYPKVLYFRMYAASQDGARGMTLLLRLSRLAYRLLRAALLSAAVARRLLFPNADAGPDPLGAAVYRRLGDIEVRIGFLAGAARAYALAISCNPGSPALHYLRGVALLEKRDNAQAAEEFEIALALDPQNRTLVRLLRLSRSENSAEAAKTHYYRRRGSLKRKLGFLDSAISDYERAIDICPDDPDLYLVRGRALLEKGQTSRAARDFRKGLALDPNSGVLVEFLAKAEEAGARTDSEEPFDQVELPRARRFGAKG